MTRKITYFGYGSLVNRDTRDPAEQATHATLNGWIRQWAHRAQRPWQHRDVGRSGSGVSALTVEQDKSSSIDGVLVDIDESQLSVLDEREAGYHRVLVPASQFQTEHEINSDTVLMYVTSEEYFGWANQEHPLINSYIDCVMIGFRTQFGEEGADRFLQTTKGWDLELYNDRHLPLYPRALDLTVDQTGWIDERLRAYR